jgi:probable rRNA maturation factor
MKRGELLMQIIIERETDISLEIDEKEVINRVVEAALDHLACPYEAQVNVLLTDNAAIAEINRDYREIDRPTDVLSFPMMAFETPGDLAFLEEAPAEDYFDPDTGELLLGDIIISVEKVIEQAELYGHSRQRELGFLVAHSMLHLFGFDHMEEDERLIMEEKQREIMDLTGLKR